MAKRARKFYSPAEKSAFIAEVERLYRAGDRSFASIARELGLHDSSYHSWVRQGFKVASPPVPVASVPAGQRVFEPGDRERLVIEVDGLRAQGQSVKAACQAVGISDKSYHKWKRGAVAHLPMRMVEVTALVPVPTVATALTLVSPRPAPPVLTLVAPGGYRIEGLGVDTAAKLLRALT